MQVTRKEFLQIACRAGLAILGGGAFFDIVPGSLVLAEMGRRPAGDTRLAIAVDILKFVRSDDFFKCINACHTFYNVPDIESPKHEVKWIWKEKFRHAFQEQSHSLTRNDLKSGEVLVLCNHCDNPPCVRVCPTRATWRRKDGIIMMDMHRCIGCRYCMAACPYGARSFNWMEPRKVLDEQAINPEYPTRTKGVVEKCNFCSGRIDKGLKPLCVEVCKNNSIIFGNISDKDSKIRKVLSRRYTIRRKPSLGTDPQVYYLI